MSAQVSTKTKLAVIERAAGLCEYCKNPMLYATGPFSVEHIFPKAKGGLNDLGNLALACSACNHHKFVRTEFLDPISKTIVPLFNPRIDVWNGHFSWDVRQTLVLGETEIGRATIAALNMNRPESVNLRQLLVLGGIHPPTV